MPCFNTYGPNNEMRACKPSAENPFQCERSAITGARHHVKCSIQWIDKEGNPTPDYNDAIGVCFTEAHTRRDAQGSFRYDAEGQHFPICAEHAKRFETYPERERLAGAHWKLIPLAQYNDCETWVGPEHKIAPEACSDGT